MQNAVSSFALFVRIGHERHSIHTTTAELSQQLQKRFAVAVAKAPAVSLVLSSDANHGKLIVGMN